MEWRRSCGAGRQAQFQRGMRAELLGSGEGEGKGDSGLDSTLTPRLSLVPATTRIKKTDGRECVARGSFLHAPPAPDHWKAG